MRYLVSALALMGVASSLSACVIAPEPGYYRERVAVDERGDGGWHNHNGYYDHDRDGYGHYRRW